jgi:hypothetical protein
MDPEPLDPREIRVGTKALLRWGGDLREVEVIEERGKIPSQGTRLVRIMMPTGDDSPLEFEVLVDWLLRVVEVPGRTSRRTQRRDRRIPA